MKVTDAGYVKDGRRTISCFR